MATSSPINPSAASPSIVAFEPSNQLIFKKTENEGLESAPVQDTLKITNLLTNEDILFRVQTTSPLTYRVKPSNGRISAGESISVQVVMIAESTKPDKFLIKYVPISPDVSSSGNFMELFKTVEANAQEHRLKCSVLQADGTPFAYAGASPSPVQSMESAEPVAIDNGAVSPSAAVPVTAPIATTTADTTTTTTAGAASGSAVNTALSTPTAAKPASKPIVNVTAPSPAADPRDAKIQALTTKNQELTRQLEDAQKALLKASSKGNTEVPPEWIALLNSQTGFPPVLVVLIALFSFLIGLLF